MTTKKQEVRKVPNLRFPEFEGEWESKEIGQTMKIGSGRDYKHLTEGEIPVFGTGGYMTSVNDYLMDGETVCIGRKGTINKPFYYSGKFWTVDTLFYTHSFKDIIPKFAFHVFEHINWLKYNEASGVPSLSKSTIEQIEIEMPSIPEQNKVGLFLSLIDERIQYQSKIIEGLMSFKSAVSRKIFSQELRFKNENGEEFEEWREVSLGDITYKVGKKNKNNIQYSIYSINNKAGFVPQSEQFEGMDSTQRGYDISLYKIIEQNTFAYNPARINVGSLGYSGELNDIIISSLYVCFKTTETVNDNFLLQYFYTPEFNFMVNNYTEGGVRQYLFYENFSIISLNLPSKTEQTKIANFLSGIDEKIDIETSLLQQLKLQKQYFLQQMFI